MGWRSMDTAPLDEPIILNVGFPNAVVGIWNPMDEAWVYASLQIAVCEGEPDNYFENEREKRPTAWQPMPEIR